MASRFESGWAHQKQGKTMWTLWIISTVIGLEEPRVTRYQEFNSKLECQVAWHQVTSNFTQDETAFCEGTDK